MGDYADGVRRRWKGMVDGPDRQRTGHSNTGHGNAGDGQPTSSGTGYENAQPNHGKKSYGKEWDLVHAKFREMKGREPYSLQELKDWWS